VLTGALSNFVAADGVAASYSRTAGETVAGSPYTISATLAPAGVLGNYDITYNTAAFTIGKRAATWTTQPASKTYGDDDPNPLTTGSGSNFVASDNVTATYGRAAGETVAGGPYHITATLGPMAVLSNYTITNAGADFTITKRSASWTTQPASKTYGDVDPSPLTTGSGSNFVAADNVTATYSRAAGETVAASPYHITAALAPAGVLDNYSITNAGADFTINKRQASVTPAAAGKTYGDADPVLTGALSNFVAADGVAASYSRTAGETVAGSPYTISATLAPAGVLGNYDITYNTAAFNIGKRTASVTPAAAGKTYGDADPALTGALSNFVAADGVTATYSRTAGETVAGSPYTISATLSPAGVLGNYTITYNTAAFNIGKRTATWTTNPNSKTYGDPEPNPLTTGSGSNFVAADNVTATYSRVAGETVSGGPYLITATLGPVAVLANYTITNTGANFTINKATPAVVWANPADIIWAAPLTSTQLNAVVNGVNAASSPLPGAKTYTPAVNTVLTPGANQSLLMQFVPTDVANYNNASKTVYINVLDKTAPIVSSTTVTPNPVAMGTSSVTLTATISDATTGGSKITGACYKIDGGACTPVNGFAQQVTVNVSANIPIPNVADVIEVCVYATDAGGNTNTKMDCALIAVYDPSAGFVTGGGWINSPAGAYVANPGLTGKATFGFVSKYKKGQTIPDGNTEFQFEAAGFNFKSTSYEWLVVAGTKAQYKGSGTINGSGDYFFMLTAIDADVKGKGPDTFRMKVWNKTTLAVIYDNQIGLSDSADPTMSLGGGSIQIHQ